MLRSRAARLTLLSVAIVLVVALVATVVAAFVVVRRPLPQVEGTLRVPGLQSPVTVTRDARGIPTITADSAADLFRAQGYVAAQDRFFEMDYRRHVVAGRLSELVGENEDALDADKVIRTFGWHRIAQQELEILEPATREALEAYAAGVNAYLDGKAPSQIAVEYTVLGLQVQIEAPEPWDAVDSLAWLKAMAWDLRGNYDDELGRARAFASVRDVAKVDQLFPPYPQALNAPILAEQDLTTATPAIATQPAPDLDDSALQSAVARAQQALEAVPHLMGDGEGVGSNSWVIGGDLTESGKPLLANDPHLGISAPGIWTQVGLRCATVGDACPYDVSGFSFAGFPGVVIGHNADLAWGLTNLGADVTDFFLERVDSTGEATMRGTETAPITTRTEVIKVNGGDDVHLDVRETVHGPIVSDVLDVDTVGDAPVEDGAFGRDYVVALAWTALAPGRTADAVLAMDTARDADDIARVGRLFDVPSQNIVFATRDGHIGYQAPGRVPLRNRVSGDVPSDGTWPRPGWDPAYDWQGYVDPEEMPRVQDPAEGFLVAANQAVTPAGVGPFLTKDWDYGYRAQRIRDVIEAQVVAGEKITAADVSALQGDERSPYADVLVPALLRLDIDDTFDDDGQELLRTWDHVASEDSAAAAYFAAVWSTLLELAFADDLPDGDSPNGGSRWLEVVRSLLDDPDSPWWDDRSTPGVVEGRDEVLTRAMVTARRELTQQLGRDAEDWRWGRLHVAAPEHPVLGGSSVPGLVRRLVNPEPIEVGGGSSIVDATAWDASAGYGVTAGPSMRMVVDLGDLDSSTWVTFTGSSGHPGSAHYTDQFGPWAAGETFPWPFSPAATAADAVDRLTLEP
ncbi:penicillin acylase family protein [Cellulomonas sp.]|uniref:penicillin acylase family protein n=1 Tax=Cellulomonas sp. TaxID=40001 RepID=UPI00258F1898|nr:penicillin acylase family protein [Cellulomonas sp.]MCR6688062.1 penicillin acylase family protein [Cellulomonas sp.]